MDDDWLTTGDGDAGARLDFGLCLGQQRQEPTVSLALGVVGSASESRALRYTRASS